ncbi:serine/threonine protein kinase [Nostoc piscinale CENA21]|uniref:histidine kinase n=1 Tax=Nostoc piscinale CENA21 TaxID=224013 RepID=A0A0M4SMR7_9NOSO|nr:ATP-binding sensor histidine kinase [Nostoc piscinale]ALF54435.1 serine/threonine protein kinase [Nostoc piscinale CENA21]
MVNTIVSIPGYQVTEELYNGSRTLVYRGYREADSLKVVIKLLKNPYPSFEELVQFRNQYTITKNFNSPLIIQTYSLEPYQNGYVLLMEDFGGISLKEWGIKRWESGMGENSQSLQEFLEIAIALCNTLEILYRERIIHKDIKPSNILINPKTKQVKLIDFSIASLLPRETQTLVNPNVLEGTLAYISPEQTGRMNRGIDYRTDFYSLGVTFYELLTGKLPFQSNDAMDWVHCHIAKQPLQANQINPKIPPVLSEIVSKLMAKNAENRYQSALGLKYDLENCLQQLRKTGEIDNFVIGQRDVCDRFLIPDQIYGREAEVNTLLEAFARVSTGATEIMLVSGFSGIGKTAVVNEVHKPIVKQHGYFIKGKFDQFNRNIPFSAFVQAFRDLIGQLLTESDTQIQQWQSKILAVIGENGQVIIDVIPELEIIIGKQPPVPELSGTAAENRFYLIWQKFTKVFTSNEHPLVLFLDDLQWAEAASLKLMQLLITESKYLLLIGAYRDHEVSPIHPLMLTLGEIEKKHTKIYKLHLLPLSQGQVNQLVADTLKCSENLASPLSQLIAQKTHGNPFFTTQFLKALHQDKLIQFNFDLGCWECDITKISQQAVTNDVVTFMTFQLQRLPLATQYVLQLAAYIGNQFDLTTLAIVAETSEIEVAADLWKALQEGLILPTTNIYKFYQRDIHDELIINDENHQISVQYRFLHDRIQQAAYSLIPLEQKQKTHYRIGKLLLQKISPAAREERIFELVNQLNHGADFIIQASEREELARLNLIACRKAKVATAYQAAREYATVGLSLLTAQAWQQQYEITLAFHELAAELAMLCGDFEAMEQFVNQVIQQAKSLPEKIQVYRIKIQSLVSQNKFSAAIAIAQTILQQLGVTLKDTPTPVDIQQEIQAINQLIGNRKIADLVHLPLMTDATKLAIVQIAGSIMPVAYLSGSPLFPLLISLSVKISIQYGNTPATSYIYCSYSVLLCNFLQDVDTATEFGQLALQLTTKLDAKAAKPQVYLLLGLYIRQRKSHIQESLPLLQEGYSMALEVGELEFAGHNAHNFCFYAFCCGQPLMTLEQETRAYCTGLMQLNQLTTANYCRIYWQAILNLLGFTENPTILSGEALKEGEFISRLRSGNDGYGLYIFSIYKLMLCFWFADIESATNYAMEVKRYFMAGAGLATEPVFYFYDSLLALAQLDKTSAALERVAENQTKLQHWAHYAPMNHQHKVDLIEAEKHRVLGKFYEAGDFYDRAISGAKINGYIQEEALANELAAKFYLNWGKEKIAAGYMQEAYYCYARWGAKAKVIDLEKHYPQLLHLILQQPKNDSNFLDTIASDNVTLSTRTSSSNSTSYSEILDLASVIKAAQAISSSLELNELITNLLQIILENSGAEKAILLLPQNHIWQVQAIAVIENGKLHTILESELLETYPDIPRRIIYYVKNTQEKLVIENCQTDIPEVIDEYMLQHQPQSLLCTPILNQRHLVGLLYLENKLTAGVFTQERVQVIKLLASQAAISLENAQLFQKSQQALQDSLLKQFSIDRASIGIWWVEEDASIFYVNDAACLDLGYQREEIIGKNIFDFDAGFPQELWAEHWQSLSQKGFCVFESYHRHKNGQIFPVEVTVNYVEFNGKAYNFAFSRNISEQQAALRERQQAEAAVKQKSEELEAALHNLQQAQLQMVQSEKMSALGNLVAGVAHEMNNPLGFIAASLKQTQPTIAEIFEHLRLYQASLPHPSEQIQEHAEEIDLDYSLEDLPKVIDAMILACDRLKNISTSLRTFSRADQDYKVGFNIHEGIDSTILILRHRLKANEKRPAIEVITDYGNIPAIECFPGQLNQVFMNILANAIDALEEVKIDKNPVVKQQITIQTSLKNQYVEIKIADNGIGMNAEVKQKIFDNLFTTKGVGKGTGLGLAIARQIIVEKHGGSIECNSSPGQGTEFVILIPISQ